MSVPPRLGRNRIAQAFEFLDPKRCELSSSIAFPVGFIPGGELAVAQRQGRLHRNLQGHSTHAECDLVGIGTSAIGSVGPTYSQNFRTLGDYYDCIEQDRLPVMRGIELSADDLARRAVIQSLMCHFELSKEAIEIAYLINFDRYSPPSWTSSGNWRKTAS